jgi:hypothetical protein
VVWAVPLAQETDTTPLPQDVHIEGDWNQPRLVVAGQIVFEQSGTHLGRPRISPDGAIVAVTVLPAGTETDSLAQIYLFSRQSGKLLDRIPGHSPQWQDNRQLVYDANGRRALYDRTTGHLLHDPAVDAASPPIESAAPTQLALDYPTTIRVAHHPENNCRDVPDWQIDEIPFEEYVKRSVPAEMPASWPIEALKAQAVAARTYAWYKIRNGPVYTPQAHGAIPYDVTDWANFQMMCNNDGPFAAKIETVVAATAGQYLSPQGEAEQAPIIAMYSAQNSHPTLDNPNVSYLRAVPDLYGLGKARYGHGYGLSQWGALDRANAGYTYRQILGHYYTGVDLQNAFEPTQPIGGLLGLAPSGYLSPGGIRWAVLGPAAPLASKITVADTGDEGAEPLTLNGRNGVWRTPSLGGENSPVTVSLWLDNIWQEAVTLRRDHTPPLTPALTLPDSTEVHTVSLTVQSDAGDRIGLHNGWIWQAETLSSTLGTVVEDPEAHGHVRLARAGDHGPGYWYGPYTTDLLPQAAYRALFRLRLDGDVASASNALLPDSPVARLDVTDQGGDIRLGLRDIWVSDFPAGEAFIEIPVDFYIFQPPNGLEFRVQWFGEVDLVFDQVEVFQIFAGGNRLLSWPLAAGETATVTAVAFDAAGNISSPVTGTTRIVDEHPPTIEPMSWPQGWQTHLPITLTATVLDRGSGLDFGSGGLWLNEEQRAVSFSHPGDPWAKQQMTSILTDVSEGQHLFHFRVADRLGHLQQSDLYPLQVDLTRPIPGVRAIAEDGSGLTAVDTWFASPLWVELSGEDAVSGLQALAYVLDAAPFELYAEPFAVAAEGRHSVRYWAQDRAGHYSFSQYFDFGIDLTPPVIDLWLQAANADAITVAWQVEDTLSGVSAFYVEVQDADGAWQPIDVADVSTVQIPFAGAEEIRVRVRATDRTGHTSEWKTLAVAAFDHWLYLPHLFRPGD